MYHIRAYLVSARYQPATKIRICRYVCARVGYVLCATYVRKRSKAHSNEYHNINTLSRVQAHVPVYPLLTSLAVFVQAHVPVYPSHTLAVCVQAPSPGDLDNH